MSTSPAMTSAPVPTLSRRDRWLPAAAAALCWALAAGGAALWWLHMPIGAGLQAAAPSPVAASPTVNTPAVLRSLGQASAAPEPAGDVSRRFQLLGVVAGASGQGAALLAVDGQPPQAFVQGQNVADGWRVQSLSADGVRLAAQGVAPLLLSLPSR